MSGAERNGLLSLVRREALIGKAHARLARPQELAKVSIGKAWAASFLVASALAAGFLALPVSQKFVGIGYVVGGGSNGVIVRASMDGTVAWIAAEGDGIGAGGLVAEIERASRWKAGSSAKDLTRLQLETLSDGEQKEAAYINERYALSVAQIQAERQAKVLRLRTVEASLRSARDLAEVAKALNDRVGAEAAGTVTKLDALAIAERFVSATGRAMALESEAHQLRTDLENSQRQERIAEVDRQRELTTLQKVNAQAIAEASTRSTTLGSAEVTERTGRVTAIYKRQGDWVVAGDQLAALSTGSFPARLVVQVPLPDRFGGAVRKGHVARLWPKGGEAAERPIPGIVQSIERSSKYSSNSGVRTEHVGSDRARTGFVATLELLEHDEGVLADKLAIGAEMGAEIVLGKKSVLELMLPERLRGELLSASTVK